MSQRVYRLSCLVYLHRTVGGGAAAALHVIFVISAFAQGGTQDRIRDSTYAYYTEGSCAQAVRRTTSTFWRTGTDSTRYSPTRDTMLTVAADAARRCVAKFDPATTQPRDLLLLAEVYLAAGNDSTASAAITLRMDWERSTAGGVNPHTLAQIASLYINAKPRRINRARPYIGMLDSIRAPEASVWQLVVHVMLLRYAYDLALDDTQATAEAQAVIATAKRLTPHDREEFSWALLQGYSTLAYFAADRKGTVGAHAVLQRARKDIGSLRDVAVQLDERDSLYTLYGSAAPPLSGVWFGVAPDAIRPTPGKISLIVLAPSREIMPALHRLQSEFGQQLDITIVTQTVGYIEGRGPVTPAGEMAYLWKHYHTTIAAPGALVLSETRFKTLPDGRRIAELTENQRAYKAQYHAGFVLVDRQGVIRTVQIRFGEQRLAAEIQRLL